MISELTEKQCTCCGKILRGKVSVREIALIHGKHYPFTGLAYLDTRDMTLNVSQMKREIKRKYHCYKEEVKLSLSDYFKIPGEVIPLIGYGIESVGIICEGCGELISEDELKWKTVG